MTSTEQRNSTPGPTEGWRNDSLVEAVQRILHRGRCIAERYYLPEAIGIGVDQETDYTAFSYYLTQRLLRTSIYNSSFFLSRPGMSVVASMPLIGRLVHQADREDRNTREVLQGVEEATTAFVAENYLDDISRRHAKTIELAVNELVARLTVDNGKKARIVFDKQTVSTWGNRWKPLTSTLLPPTTWNSFAPFLFGYLKASYDILQAWYRIEEI